MFFKYLFISKEIDNLSICSLSRFSTYSLSLTRVRSDSKTRCSSSSDSSISLAKRQIWSIFFTATGILSIWLFFVVKMILPKKTSFFIFTANIYNGREIYLKVAAKFLQLLHRSSILFLQKHTLRAIIIKASTMHI